jgi:hypothetical protein
MEIILKRNCNFSEVNKKFIENSSSALIDTISSLWDCKLMSAIFICLCILHKQTRRILCLCFHPLRLVLPASGTILSMFI